MINEIYPIESRLSDFLQPLKVKHKSVIINLFNTDNRDYDVVGGNEKCNHVEHNGKCKYCGANLQLIGFNRDVTDDWSALNLIASNLLVDKVIFVHNFFIPNEYKKVKSITNQDIKAYRRTIITPSKHLSIYSKKPTNGYRCFNGHYLDFLATEWLQDVFWINPVDIERKYNNCTYFDFSPHQKV